MAKTVAKLTPVFDAVVAGGRVIDPKNGVHDLRDIGIRKGRIAAVAPKLGCPLCSCASSDPGRDIARHRTCATHWTKPSPRSAVTRKAWGISSRI
ncbi:MAG: hypothetical protein J2P48_04380 [Alphaproteobacteria bacterium]|nr:hypothetical protein [Alphaproteobacteria bacterium]